MGDQPVDSYSELSEPDQLRVILVAKLNAASKLILPSMVAATQARDEGLNAPQARFADLAHSICWAQDRQAFGRAVFFLHSAFLLSKKYGIPFDEDSEEGPKDRTRQVLASDYISKVPIPAHSDQFFLDTSGSKKTRRKYLANAYVAGFESEDGGLAAFKEATTLDVTLPTDGQTFVGMRGLQSTMFSSMGLAISKPFINWVLLQQKRSSHSDWYYARLPEVSQIVQDFVRHLRQTGRSQGGSDLPLTYATNPFKYSGNNLHSDHIDWVSDFKWKRTPEANTPKDPGHPPRRDHSEDRTRPVESRDRDDRSYSTSYSRDRGDQAYSKSCPRDRGDRNYSTHDRDSRASDFRTSETGGSKSSHHRETRDKDIRSRSPHRSIDHRRPNSRGSNVYPDRKRDITERLGPVNPSHSNAEPLGNRKRGGSPFGPKLLPPNPIVPTGEVDTQQDSKQGPEKKPRLLMERDVAHRYMEQILNRTGQPIGTPTSPPGEAGEVIDPLEYQIMLSGLREKQIAAGHEQEKADIYAQCDRRLARTQRELLVHQRVRLRHDELVLVSLLQDRGLQFNSCRRCLRKLKYCRHVRPVRMDSRIPYSEDEEDEEDVLYIHPDINERRYLEDPKDDSALFRALRAASTKIDDLQSTAVVNADAEDRGRDQAAKARAASDKLAITVANHLNSIMDRKEEVVAQTEGKQRTEEGEVDERVEQPNRVFETEKEAITSPQESEQRRKAGELYHAKQTAEHKATVQQVMNEAVAQAVEDDNPAEGRPLAVPYDESPREGEVPPDEDRNGQNYYTGGNRWQRMSPPVTPPKKP